jgi:hypothetical protein
LVPSCIITDIWGTRKRRSSSVGITTRVHAGQPMERSQISLKCPDWLWGPPNPLSSRYPECKALGSDGDDSPPSTAWSNVSTPPWEACCLITYVNDFIFTSRYFGGDGCSLSAICSETDLTGNAYVAPTSLCSLRQLRCGLDCS